MGFNLISFLILASGGLYIVYLVFLGKLKIRDQILESSIYLYKEITADSKQINQQFLHLDKGLSSSGIKQFSLATILYETSEEMLYKEQTLLFGAFLNPKEEKTAKTFAKQHPEYKIAHLPSIKTVTTESYYRPVFPNSVWFNYVVYTKLWQYGERNRIFFQNDTQAVVQIFSKQEENPEIYKFKTFIPYGNNTKSLILTKIDKSNTPENMEL